MSARTFLRQVRDATARQGAYNLDPEVVALRSACKAVRDAFAYMPALHDVDATPDWTAADVRAEVTQALDACLPQVQAALRRGEGR